MVENCPNCNAEITPGIKFCSNCGEKLAENLNENNKCTNCGAEIKPSNAFCPECGTKTTASNAETSNVNQNEVSVDMESIAKSGKSLAKGFGGLLKKTADEFNKNYEKEKDKQKIKEKDKREKKENEKQEKILKNKIEHDKKVEQGLIKNACGNDGELELYDDKIIIRRKGKFSFVQHGLTGDREVLINQITSIQLKHTGEFFRGYIQFSFAGAGRRRRSGPIDENTIGFWKDQEPDFLEIKEMIEAKMLKHQGLENTSEKNCDLNELEKLAELKEKGIITEEEFQAKKKQILGL